MKHILLLCNRPAKGANASTISEHIDALNNMPGWKVWELDMIGEIPSHLNLNKFHAIGIHYTIHLSDPNDHFLSKNSIRRLSQFNGLKCVWLHDEYRKVNKVQHILKEMGIDVVFSLASGSALSALYPKDILPNTRLETVLAGYVPRTPDMRAIVPIHDRTVDVGYRARRPPYWLGSLGQEKINIALDFLRCGETKLLKCDISVEETDRLYGDSWTQFLKNTKTVLCVESGASVIDLTGEIEESVEEYCRKNMNASFQEVYDKYLSEIDSKHSINPVSPRVFEAAATRTTIVAFKGEYSGLLKPWENYIPLEKDFSNVAEVVSAIKNIDILERISQQAWNDLVINHELSYEYFSKFCSSILIEELKKTSSKKVIPYSKTQFQMDSIRSLKYFYFKYIGKNLQRLLAISSVRRALFKIWEALPHKIQILIKPALKLIAR